MEMRTPPRATKRYVPGLIVASENAGQAVGKSWQAEVSLHVETCVLTKQQNVNNKS